MIRKRRRNAPIRLTPSSPKQGRNPYFELNITNIVRSTAKGLEMWPRAWICPKTCGFSIGLFWLREALVNWQITVQLECQPHLRILYKCV